MVKHVMVNFESADASAATLEGTVPLRAFGYMVMPQCLDTLKAKIALVFT